MSGRPIRTVPVANRGEIAVEGIRTNHDFLIACLEDARFAAGEVHTRFIEDGRARLLREPGGGR